MKKLVPFLCILSILIVLLNINNISNGFMVLLNQRANNEMYFNNKYHRDNNYEYVQNTTSNVPYGKQDILNIFYTIINYRQENFTLYCPNAYENCVKDIQDITKDNNILTHVNNYVHPFNSFTKIYAYIYETGEVQIKIEYLYSEEQIKELDEEVEVMLKNLNLEQYESDYDKIKAVHDEIIKQTKYDLGGSEDNLSFSAYGALFNHLATCSGYTDLMAIFLSKMGYENIKVATTDYKENTGHIWNAVKVDNEWRHLDLTWDDPVSSDKKDYLYHKYFLITTNELNIADSNITSDEHVFDKNIYKELF